MFNKDFSNMEAFFLYYDKLYDAAFERGFPVRLCPGYDYDIVDGEVVFDPTKFNEPMDAIQGVGKWHSPKYAGRLPRRQELYDLANGAKRTTAFDGRRFGPTDHEGRIRHLVREP